MEQLDKDIAAVIEERKETVAPMEIHALRTFMEPISLLYRGVHETEKAMSRNRGIEVRLGVVCDVATDRAYRGNGGVLRAGRSDHLVRFNPPFQPVLWRCCTLHKDRSITLVEQTITHPVSIDHAAGTGGFRHSAIP